MTTWDANYSIALRLPGQTSLSKAGDLLDHASDLSRFPPRFMEPYPQNGKLFRSVGDGDHLVAAMAHPDDSFSPHEPALMVRYRDGDLSKWQLLAAWIGTEKSKIKAGHVLVSKLNYDSMDWSKPVQMQIHGNIRKLNVVWMSDDMMPNSVLLVNVEALDKTQAVNTIFLHTMDEFDGFEAPLKKERGWSRSQAAKDLAGVHIRNPPIRGLQGEWMIPVQTPTGGRLMNSQPAARGVDLQWMSGFPIFDDGSRARASQPSVIRLKDSRGNDSRYLVAYCQSVDSDVIWRSISQNDGRSWTPLERTELPSNNRPVQALTLVSGSVALVFDNNNGERVKGDSRAWPLSIALSMNGGQTWSYVRDLMPEFDPRKIYSSPSMVQTPDGSIHIMFTEDNSIRYQRITEDWIKGGFPWGSTRGWYTCDSGVAAVQNKNGCSLRQPDAAVGRA
mmetsp:Transcript_1272/g.3652  ORF Transcript_1272/g.3652 Transcript_1272/m.3652 type:complete len:446 (+) Transcript_1272:157-1494(+)